MGKTSDSLMVKQKVSYFSYEFDSHSDDKYSTLKIMDTQKEIRELQLKIDQLKSKENFKNIEQGWEKIKNFFEKHSDKDFCSYTLNKDGSFESLYIKRIEKVRHQPTFPGIGYMVVDYTELRIGYDFKSKGYFKKYIENNTNYNEQDFSSFGKAKTPSMVEIPGLFEKGFPLKSKKSYKTEYNSIVTNGKLQTHTNSYEFRNHILGGWELLTQKISKDVFDSMMKLYIKQTLESQEFLQNLNITIVDIQK